MTRNDIRLAQFMPYQLSIASNAVSDLIAREYRSRFGLKIPEWRVMALLGEVGEATQRELVAASRMDKVAVKRATKALADRNLIIRVPNASDGRSHHLALTDKGVALRGEIWPLALEMEGRVASVLSEEDKVQLADLLARLLARAEALAGD